MNYAAEYLRLRRPTITQEEYVKLRESGVMASEMAMYDLSIPTWCMPNSAKKILNPKKIHDRKLLDCAKRTIDFYPDWPIEK